VTIITNNPNHELSFCPLKIEVGLWVFTVIVNYIRTKRFDEDREAWTVKNG
jgi:hypothetical protein